MTVFIAPPRFGVLCSPGSPLEERWRSCIERTRAASAAPGSSYRTAWARVTVMPRPPSLASGAPTGHPAPWSWLCPSTAVRLAGRSQRSQPYGPPADTFAKVHVGVSVWGRSCRWICGRVTRAGEYVAELHYNIHTGQWTNCSRTSGRKVREREKKEMRGAEALAVAVCVPW
jgi:hypothetical protein